MSLPKLKKSFPCAFPEFALASDRFSALASELKGQDSDGLGVFGVGRAVLLVVRLSLAHGRLIAHSHA